MSDDLVLSLIDSLEPNEVPLRYISHATYTLGQHSYKVTDPKQIERFINHDIEYAHAQECRVFYHLAYLLRDVQDEVDFIKERVMFLFRQDGKA